MHDRSTAAPSSGAQSLLAARLARATRLNSARVSANRAVRAAGNRRAAGQTSPLTHNLRKMRTAFAASVAVSSAR